MKTAAAYLDEIRSRHQLPSDYAARTLLGVTKQSISRYRTGLDHFSPETCEKVAELLGIDLEIVLLDAQESRARSDAEKAAWRRVAQRLTSPTASAGAALSGKAGDAVFIMLSWITALMGMRHQARFA